MMLIIAGVSLVNIFGPHGSTNIDMTKLDECHRACVKEMSRFRRDAQGVERPGRRARGHGAGDTRGVRGCQHVKIAERI